MSDWVWFLIIFGIGIVFFMIYAHFTIDRKPLLSAGGKIIRKNIMMGGG